MGCAIQMSVTRQLMTHDDDVPVHFRSMVLSPDHRADSPTSRPQSGGNTLGTVVSNADS